ncbi:hypothetical protein N7526_004585 [Penicillium atrosanguineum]|nr:hypothetical protein N7526_004585 [Penicillium atrosanguineum]
MTSSLNISRVTHNFKATSDDEEDIKIRLDIPAATAIPQATVDAPPLSAIAAGKRPAVTSGDEEGSDTNEFKDSDENSVSPLPGLPDTQYSASGRIRKKSRLLDGCIV